VRRWAISTNLVLLLAVPKPDGSLSAVVVSGGKQYRVAPGDQILVDRLGAEPGSSLKLDRVLLFMDGTDLRIGTPAVEGIDVEVKVIAHRRGPRIETLRYKSKKRVRVHRGGRADLTALQIIAVGGRTAGVEKETASKPTKEKPGARKKVAAVKAQAAETAEPAEKEGAAAPAKRATRKPKAKETK
jgi:large subunit ribosomal protein L21